MDVKNKIALVTGGSRGLGKDMAISLARNGNDVMLTYRSSDQEANATAAEIEKMGRKAAVLQLDMRDFNSIHGFVQQAVAVFNSNWQVNSFDYLINNAGMGATVPFEQVTEAMFDDFLNVHFKGVYFLTQQFVPFLNPGGCIINISTGTTRFSNPGYSVYASMKGAVEVFTRYLAKELGSKGIRANVVAPGPVETDFNNALIRSNPAVKERLSAFSPLNRVGTPSDIGGVVAFLCSDEGSWINGQRIEVSGGINV